MLETKHPIRCVSHFNTACHSLWLLVCPLYLSYDWSMDSFQPVSSLADTRLIPLLMFFMLLVCILMKFLFFETFSTTLTTFCECIRKLLILSTPESLTFLKQPSSSSSLSLLPASSSSSSSSSKSPTSSPTSSSKGASVRILNLTNLYNLILQKVPLQIDSKKDLQEVAVIRVCFIFF